MRPFGFNVIGHVSGNVGLGVVARSAIALMLRKGYPVATLDIDPGYGRGGKETAYDYLAVRTADELPYGVTLSVFSVTALPDVVIDGRVPLRDDVISAGYFWWELPTLLEIWSESLALFDVLVAGSQFIRGTFERHVSGIPTILARCAVADFRDIRADRPRFGIPSDKTAFICIVEPTSDTRRKNPYAAIEAFAQAFRAEDRAHLVVKVNNPQAESARTASLTSLREAVDRLGPRVTLIEKPLPHREVMGLFASCDVFVGLHRAEGLGLGLMEAMALGKAVIATGWSGNMSFMDHTNACLIGYRLVPVSGDLKVYSPEFLKHDVRWAEPHIDEAAAWMRQLAANPALREEIGRKAREDIDRYRMESERGLFIEELRAIYEHEAARLRRPRGDLHGAIAALREARFAHRATPIDRLRRKSSVFLDRHLLWRFRPR